MTDNFDYNKLDAGIRETVRLLRGRGFSTTDSGDGTKAEAMDCAVGFPMIAMRVDKPEYLVGEADRLHRILSIGHKLSFGAGSEEANPHAPFIEATYSPIDKVSMIVLGNVDDKRLGLEHTKSV